MAKKVSPVTGQADYPGQGWIITSGFATDEYFQRFGDWHTGHDLAKSAAGGETVFAATDGVIKWAESAGDGGFGNLVYIQHSASLYTRYGHLAAITVQKDQTVSAGTPIGTVGKTGRATGPHLHFDISRTNNALDWPGKDKARVLQNYIDPTAWYSEDVTATVVPVATQWLYTNAINGLNIRNNPGTTGKIYGKLPFGTAVQVTSVRLNKDGFDWRQLVTGGWIAEAYTQTTPPEVIVTPGGTGTPVTTPPIVVQPPVTPSPATINVRLRGVHASAGGWSPDDREIELVRHNGVESVLIVAYEPNQAGTAIQRFRDAGVKDFIIRAASHAATTANPDDFINDTLPRLRDYYSAIGSSTPMLIAVHNEPESCPRGLDSRMAGWQQALPNGFCGSLAPTVMLYPESVLASRHSPPGAMHPVSAWMSGVSLPFVHRQLPPVIGSASTPTSSATATTLT